MTHLFWFLPILHPLLIPLLGAPSHLLWWAHVLPVARMGFDRGRKGAGLALAASAMLVLLGERLFGYGYGSPASWETTLSLTTALFLTNLLVSWFALHARRITLQYRVLLAGLPVGAVLLDDQARVVRMNRAAETLLAAGETDLRGQGIHQLLQIEGIESLDQAASRGTGSGRATIAAGDTTRVIPVFWVVLQHPDGEGWQLLLADRSTELLQEREVQQKARLASLGQAMAGLAHEMRSPLTGILLEVDLAAFEGSTEDTSLSAIRRQAIRLKDMVDDLLGFSRHREDDRCDLGEVVHRVVRVQGLAAGRHIHLSEEVGCDGMLPFPSGRLEQVLLNLVSNAVDALPPRGGRIRVTCEARGDGVLIAVQDSGPGIPEALLERIFDPFVTTKPEGKGTGLGLAISRDLVDGMGGCLTARNLAEGGARFEIHLPGPLEPLTRQEAELVQQR